MEPVFIALEGVDGCGKSTQAELLKQYLESRGYEARVVADPGTTVFGQRMREILLDKNVHMDNAVQTLAFFAVRADTARVVSNYLEKGISVIADRWFMSTVVYQGLVGGIALRRLVSMDRAFVKLRPRYVLFEMPALAAMERRNGRSVRDRFESQEVDYHRKIWQAYNDAYEHVYFKSDTVVVSGEGYAGQVHGNIVRSLAADYLPFKGMTKEASN